MRDGEGGARGLDTDGIVDATETVKMKLEERRTETGGEAQEERHSKRGIMEGSEVQEDK